jgi:hypothetical protein
MVLQLADPCCTLTPQISAVIEARKEVTVMQPHFVDGEIWVCDLRADG